MQSLDGIEAEVQGALAEDQKEVVKERTPAGIDELLSVAQERAEEQMPGPEMTETKEEEVAQVEAETPAESSEFIEKMRKN